MDVVTKVLLTGGRGMVGKNILEHPLAEQWQFLSPSSQELDLKNYQANLSVQMERFKISVEEIVPQ